MTQYAITPQCLGLEKAIDLVAARQETFFYRGKDKRIIDHRVANERRWRGVPGPFVYAVTDRFGLVRYVGKWESFTPLHSRWLRHDTIHHHEKTRKLYLAELDGGRGPLQVWSISSEEIRARLPESSATMSALDIAKGLEALWIKRWKPHLTWNGRDEKLVPGFDDGEYWKRS